MAYNVVPSPNTPNTAYGAYDSAQYAMHDVVVGEIGVPHVAASGIVTGNGQYALFTAVFPSYAYGGVGTVTTPGTGATSNVQLYLVRANNGVNVSSNVAIGNLITTGINAAGNVYQVGPFAYNVYANLVNTGANTITPGGISLNVGDTIVAVHTGNTLVMSIGLEVQVSANAMVTK